MTSRLCPTAPRNFGKRGEGGLWGCSCDSLCLCVPLHPAPGSGSGAVPPGFPAPGLCVCGMLGQEDIARFGRREGRSSSEVLGRKSPTGAPGVFMANVPRVLAAEPSAGRACAPSARSKEMNLLCFSTCVSTANRKNGSKPPFSIKSQLGARGALRAVLGEDCRPLAPRATPTVSVQNIVGKVSGIFPCFISPFLLLFLTKKNNPNPPPRTNFVVAEGCVRRP